LATGEAPLGDPPTAWNGEQGTNIRWKVAIPGRGSATPVIWDDKIFILTAIPTAADDDGSAEPPPAEPPAAGAEGRRGGGRGGFRQPPPTKPFDFVVMCLDRQTGKTLWQQTATSQIPHEGGHATNTFASGSPITDGKHVWASFGSYGIYCYDMDGNQKWSRDLGDMQTRASFGEGASPTLAGDTLIVTWDHEGEDFIIAMDALTGETKWQVDRDEPTTWSTPLVVAYEGRQQVVTNGTNRVRSYDLASGELLWQCGGQMTNPIPCPVSWDGMAFCMSGYQGNAVYALPLGGKGDLTDTDQIVWSRNDAGPYVPSPLLYRGRLYFTKSRDNILSCLDAKTGEPIIDQQRVTGLGGPYASPVAAKDRLYFVGRDGQTVVMRFGDQIEVLATNPLGEGVDASPVIVDRQLFLRGAEHLFCIEAT
jgi:outer membrane protein assembly factor BamB